MVFKVSVFLILLLVVGFGDHHQGSTIVVEARPISILAQENYSKIFSSLGVVCKCCDGSGSAIAGGTDEDQCTTSWHGTCSDIQCLPWKFRS